MAGMHAPLPDAYRRDIDGLRAVAVLAVLIYHAFPRLLPGGFAGVDIFFVISGFVITRLLLAQPGLRPGQFYARRARRLLPALVAMLAASWAAGWWLLTPVEFTRFGLHMASSAPFAANLLFRREVEYFDGEMLGTPLLHLWSLGVEAQFYLLWPMLLWLSPRMGLRAGVLLSGMAALSFAAMLDTDAETRFYSPLPRFWEFAAGGLLALRPLPRRHALLATAGVALTLAGLLSVGIGNLLEAVHLLLPVLGAALLISQPESFVARHVLASRPFVWLGSISYPLYLWHWPLLSFQFIAYSGKTTPEVRLGLLLASMVLAWLSTRFLERPIRRGRGKLAALCALLVLAGALGYATMAAHGFPARWGSMPAVAANYNAWAEHRKRLRMVRDQQCHLDRQTPFSKYQPDPCLRLDPARANLLIMGDSHAADLYAALSLSHPQYHLLQATAAGCFLDTPRYSTCQQLVYTALEFAKHTRLDAVLLAGRWNWSSARQPHLQSMIDALRQAGQRVILVGPPLEFSATVPSILARMPQGGDTNAYVRNFIRKVPNAQMAKLAQDNGILYLDRVLAYCGEQMQCDVTDNLALFVLDYGHLSQAGMAYLGQRIRVTRALEQLVQTPRRF